MKTKHTPGPWLVRYNMVTTALNLKIVDSNEDPICEFADPIYANKKNGIKSERESKANANLIAAAPEMLAILEQLDMCNGPENKTSAAIAIRKVIAKARGES